MKGRGLDSVFQAGSTAPKISQGTTTKHILFRFIREQLLKSVDNSINFLYPIFNWLTSTARLYPSGRQANGRGLVELKFYLLGPLQGRWDDFVLDNPLRSFHGASGCCG